MASINLLIAPIQGYTATQRAEAISREVYAISRPQGVRQPEDTLYLFGWLTHPTTGQCVLLADTAYVIPVHPQNNLTNLIALFPDLSEAEKQGLAAFIAASNEFAFNAIIPSTATILSEQDLIDKGFVTLPEL